MRVYFPVSLTSDFASLQYPLEAEALVWGVSDRALSGLKPDDREEKEFDALCEAVLVEASRTQNERVVIGAADLDANALTAQPSDQHGEYCWSVLSSGTAKIVAFLVSELRAEEILADDYAPDMLWFDPSEPQAAFEYVREGRA